MKPSEISLMEKVGEKIVSALEGIPLEVEGSPKAAVKYKDGSFKMKPVFGGWNFFMEYAYLGKKGEIIFGLSPEDAQEYETAEWSYSVMDTVFPLAGSQLAKALNMEGENFKSIFYQFVTKCAEDAIEAEKRAHEEYLNNPKFGMF